MCCHSYSTCVAPVTGGLQELWEGMTIRWEIFWMEIESEAWSETRRPAFHVIIKLRVVAVSNNTCEIYAAHTAKHYTKQNVLVWKYGVSRKCLPLRKFLNLYYECDNKLKDQRVELLHRHEI